MSLSKPTPASTLFLAGPEPLRLPRYEGYEWRRMGTDVVLIAIGTGIVYEVLQGVLN